MQFHERLYQLHIILGNKDTPPLWQPQGWQAIQEDLSKVTKATRGPVTLKSLQYAPNGQFMHEVKFGQLSLSDKAERKWLHDYTTFPERKEWLFHSVDAWAPSRIACANQGLAPDVFLGIGNECYYKTPSPLLFNPYVIVAGAIDKGEEFIAAVDKLADVIIKHTNAVLHIQKISPWGRSSLGGFTDAIGDLLASGAFKPGLRQSDIPLIEQIQEYWK